MNFKVSKCKVMMTASKEKMCTKLNGQVMDQVKDHVYLGNVISEDGGRMKDLEQRIKDSKGVVNEIIFICKETQLSTVRLRFVDMLRKSCLDSKLKYGCAFWNVKSRKVINDLNKIKISLLKRVLEVPQSTPSIAIQYEFGICDLDLEVLMEKVILAVQVVQLNDNRVGRQLMEALMVKNVGGFCSEVVDACLTLKIGNFSDLIGITHIRKYLKKKLVELQKEIVFMRMLESTKMNGILLRENNKFDGKMKPYLKNLNFQDARSVFMLRCRMYTVSSLKKRFRRRQQES